MRVSPWEEGQALLASIGRIVKNPAFELKHPRGRDGRFIWKNGGVKWVTGAGLWFRGTVTDINDDGTVSVRRDLDNKIERMSSRRLYQATARKATLRTNKMQKVGAQAGSNTGGFYAEPDSDDTYYVKTLKSAQHVGNESLANRLYTAAGAAAPEVATTPDGKRFMSKIEESKDWNHLSGEELDRFKEEVAKDFVVDAWLANWDAPLNDNVRWDEKNQIPLRVDNGGAVMFRARGDRRILTPHVGELVTMRDPNVSGAGARMYSKVTKDHEVDAAKRILAISPDEIREMVAEEKLPKHVADDLIARRAWLATNYNLELPESTREGKEYLDELKKAVDSGTVTPTTSPAVSSLPKANKVSDDAVPISPGAPVWVKNKNNATILSGNKIPDVMLVTSLSDYSGNLAKSAEDMANMAKATNHDMITVEMAAPKGGSAAVAPLSDVELLRGNFASVKSKYASGESVNMGDAVNSAKFGDGYIADVYPMYAKVKFADGTTKVMRTNGLTKSDKDPAEMVQAKTPASPNTAKGAGDPIGELFEWDNDHVQTGYSFPHDATGLVLTTDDTSGTVVFGNGSRAKVNLKSLYKPETVNAEAADAKRAQLEAAQAKRKAAPARQKGPVDLSKLKPRDVKPSRRPVFKGDPITVQPGDRLLRFEVPKSYQVKQHALHFTVDKDGNVKAHDLVDRQITSELFRLRGRRGLDPLAARPTDEMLLNGFLDAIKNKRGGLAQAFELKDITPGDHKTAADELGAYRIGTGSTVVKRVKVRPPRGNAWDSNVEHIDLDAGSITDIIRFSGTDTNDMVFGSSYRGSVDVWLTDDNRAFVPSLQYNVSDLFEITDQVDVDKLRDGILPSASVLGFTDEGPPFNLKLSSHLMRGESDFPSWTKSHTVDDITDAVEASSASLPATPTPKGPASIELAKGTDIRKMKGYEALTYELSAKASPEKLAAGDLDDIIETAIRRDYDRKQNAPSGIYDMDGEAQADPVMASFLRQIDGDLPIFSFEDGAALTAISQQTGVPKLWRAVDSQASVNTYYSDDRAHFSGSGVSGNGTYSSNKKGTTSGYGGVSFQFGLKPNAKIASNDQAVTGMKADIAKFQISTLEEMNRAYGTPDAQMALDLSKVIDNDARTLEFLEEYGERLAKRDKFRWGKVQSDKIKMAVADTNAGIAGHIARGVGEKALAGKRSEAAAALLNYTYFNAMDGVEISELSIPDGANYYTPGGSPSFKATFREGGSGAAPETVLTTNPSHLAYSDTLKKWFNDNRGSMSPDDVAYYQAAINQDENTTDRTKYRVVGRAVAGDGKLEFKVDAVVKTRLAADSSNMSAYTRENMHLEDIRFLDPDSMTVEQRVQTFTSAMKDAASLTRNTTYTGVTGYNMVDAPLRVSGSLIGGRDWDMLTEGMPSAPPITDPEGFYTISGWGLLDQLRSGSKTPFEVSYEEKRYGKSSVLDLAFKTSPQISGANTGIARNALDTRTDLEKNTFYVQVSQFDSNSQLASQRPQQFVPDAIQIGEARYSSTLPFGKTNDFQATVARMFEFIDAEPSDSGAADRARKRQARWIFLTDTGRWALANGFDAITVDQYSGEYFYVITNRNAMLLKDR